MCKFKCSVCGSEELSYEKYVRCSTPVDILEDARIEFLPSEFNEDDWLGTEFGFACKNGHFVTRFGFKLTTEKDIRSYLQMTPEAREQESNDYLEVLAAQEEAEEESEGGFW